MTIGEVGIRSLDLNEAFAADRLVAAPRVIQIRGIVQEADGAFNCIFVQEHLDRLSIDEGIVRQLDFARSDLACRPIPRVSAEDCGNGLPSRLQGNTCGLGLS